MARIEKRGERSWRLEVSAGFDSEGKRIRYRKTITVEDDSLLKKEKKLREYLETELIKFRQEVEAGAYIKPEKMTFGQFVKEWEEKYAREHLSPGTLEAYKLHLKNHILPEFGNLSLDKIKPIHIVGFLSDLKKHTIKNGNRLSAGTIAYIYRVLRNVLERAVEWKLIKENPAASVRRPADKKEREISVYSEEEVEKLFLSAQNELPHWRMFITLALATGLRRGELLGLEWKHVDFQTGTIRIEQSLSRGEKGKPMLKDPKSKHSIREISLPSSVIEELKAYRKQWAKEKLQLLDLWEEKEHEYVFCNEKGHPFYPTYPRVWWKRFTERAGVRYIRLHDLRHTSATLLINQGVHAKIISERLGHADVRTTMNIYGHALRSADKEAAEKINDLFKKRG